MNDEFTVFSNHLVLESPSFYFIVFNFFNHPSQDVRVDIDEDKSEITILARNNTRFYQNGCFWTFGVPNDGILKHLATRFSNGVLEIKIPKMLKPPAKLSLISEAA